MPLTAVVLAAGAGTRLGPLALRQSKPMIAIAGQPMIGWILSRLRAAGIDRIVVVGHPSDRALAAYLESAGGGVQLVLQPERAGIADAVRRALPVVAKEDGYLACACDSLIAAADIARIAACGRDCRGAAAVGIIDMGAAATVSRSAVVVAHGRVMRIVEKPAPGSIESSVVALPVYWLPTAMRTYIEGVRPIGSERYLTTALSDFIAGGGVVLAVEIGERLEVTTAADIQRVETLLRQQAQAARQ